MTPNTPEDSDTAKTTAAPVTGDTVEHGENAMSLVGFFDILGTREAVMSDRFSDLISLDFAGPVGLAANFFPSMRFAVFSDSVIISAETGDEDNFLRAAPYQGSRLQITNM